MHIVGAIGCLCVAALLTSVTVDDWTTSPGWVSALALLAAAFCVGSALRIYQIGARRRFAAEGPRTRIVISAVTKPPPRSRGTGTDGH